MSARHVSESSSPSKYPSSPTSPSTQAILHHLLLLAVVFALPGRRASLTPVTPPFLSESGHHRLVCPALSQTTLHPLQPAITVVASHPPFPPRYLLQGHNMPLAVAGNIGLCPLLPICHLPELGETSLRLMGTMGFFFTVI